MNGERLPDGDDIDTAVIAWHQGDGEPVADLPEPARMIALRRLGYSTEAHLAMFGFSL